MSLSDFVRQNLQNNYKTEKRMIKKFLHGDKKILDFGCGSGNFCTIFSPKNYLGADIDNRCIKYAKKKYPKYSFKHYKKELPAKDNEFDYVLSSGVFHHIPKKHVDFCLKEIRRVAKRNAKILIMDQVPVRLQKNPLGRFIFSFDLGQFAKSPHEMKTYLEKYFTVTEFGYLKTGPFRFQVWKLVNK